MHVSLIDWIWFTSILVSAMLIPGPGVFATVAYSLSLGFNRAMAFVLGAAFGDLTFLWIALLGLGVFLQSASIWLIVLLLLASLYFTHMSYKLFRSFWQSKRAEVSVDNITSVSSNPISVFLSGYSITITNPKVIIFYLAILPVFLDVPEFGKLDYLIVSLITPFSLLGVLGFYAYATSLAKTLLKSENFSRMINLMTAIIFGVVALLLIGRISNLLVEQYL